MLKVEAACQFIKDWKNKLYFASAVTEIGSFSKIIIFV